MSCEKCHKAQENPQAAGRCFIRVDNANVELVGCDEHVGKVIKAMRRDKLVKDLIQLFDTFIAVDMTPDEFVKMQSQIKDLVVQIKEEDEVKPVRVKI